MNHLIVILVSVLALLFSLSVHEYAHALAGHLLGDDTARRMGRLTLNPIAHVDPVGTVLVPLIGAFSGLPLIGWAKPVPFNPYNLRDPKWGSVAVALAGPISNFLFAIVCLVLLKVSLGVFGLSVLNLLVLFLALLAVVNIVLGVFNFIPVPPLDGSRLLHALLDAPKHRPTLHFLETRGPMIIFFLILLDFTSPVSVFGGLLNGAIGLFFNAAGLSHILALF